MPFRLSHTNLVPCVFWLRLDGSFSSSMQHVICPSAGKHSDAALSLSDHLCSHKCHGLRAGSLPFAHHLSARPAMLQATLIFCSHRHLTDRAWFVDRSAIAVCAFAQSYGPVTLEVRTCDMCMGGPIMLAMMTALPATSSCRCACTGKLLLLQRPDRSQLSLDISQLYRICACTCVRMCCWFDFSSSQVICCAFFQKKKKLRRSFCHCFNLHSRIHRHFA